MTTKIYTGYFAHLKKYANPIAVSRTVPPGIVIPQALFLAPSYELLNRYKTDYNEAAYIQQYTQELSKYSPELIMTQLLLLVPKDVEAITLICYEKNSNFCHRHLIAEYLLRAGLDVMGEAIV